MSCVFFSLQGGGRFCLESEFRGFLFMPPYPTRPFPAYSGPRLLLLPAPRGTLTFQPDSPCPGPGLSQKPAVRPECPLVVMACTARGDSNLESREPHLKALRSSWVLEKLEWLHSCSSSRSRGGHWWQGDTQQGLTSGQRRMPSFQHGPSEEPRKWAMRGGMS